MLVNKEHKETAGEHLSVNKVTPDNPGLYQRPYGAQAFCCRINREPEHILDTCRTDKEKAESKSMARQGLGQTAWIGVRSKARVKTGISDTDKV